MSIVLLTLIVSFKTFFNFSQETVNTFSANEWFILDRRKVIQKEISGGNPQILTTHQNEFCDQK